jgi:hypothetical protein
MPKREQHLTLSLCSRSVARRIVSRCRYAGEQLAQKDTPMICLTGKSLLDRVCDMSSPL